ncbi:MAG: Uma2 family endonuclease [Saprospiraceae bacterium]|nr:Uma2 family endonuclease [Saprospiraceae bacterium]
MTAQVPTQASEKIGLSFWFNGLELKSKLPPMTEEEFLEFCQDNPDLRIETDPMGNIVAEPPVSYESGGKENEVNGDLTMWNRQTKLGKTFSPSTMFTLPDGSRRMPDAAWVSMEKHRRLSAEERNKFARVVPDFVVEVRSPSDDLKRLQAKMTGVWIANGVRLAWLIDPITEKTWVYRPDGSIDVVEGFGHTLSGESVLPGFVFDLLVLKSDEETGE